jgi:hypothetical protein
MAISAFKRAAKRIHARLGEGALLRGASAGHVIIERDVQFVGEHDQATFTRDCAHILAEYAPKTGDTLEHPDGTYKLDRYIDSNGESKRFVILPIA